MKHALLLIIAVVVIYGIWCLANPTERARALRQITKHGFRLVAVIFGVLLLLALAYYLPSTNLLG